MITTKKGDTKKGIVNAYFNRSYREVSKELDVLGPIDYARYSNTANALAGEDLIGKLMGRFMEY